MRIVKTNWRNAPSEANLTSLLCIKVPGPSSKVISDQCSLKSVQLWYNDKNHQLNQKPRGKYRKIKVGKLPRKECEFPSLFKTSSESVLSTNEDLLI